MRSIAALCMGAFLLLAGAPANANDSTASLDTGELVLVPNADIELLEEDLFISPERIRVRYLFRNTSAEPITTVVAFPLPPVDLGEDVGYAIYPKDPINFVDFRLWVDGEPKPFQTDARAMVGGRNVTDVLEASNIPLTTFIEDMQSFDQLRVRPDLMPPGVMEKLEAEGIARDEDGYFSPQWTTYVSFYWTQTFPPGQTVEIAHAYVPAPTVTFFTGYDIDERTFHDDVCIDEAFERAARKKLRATADDTLEARLLTYILTTANNWRGSIGRFHLTIDKGSTDTLVSLCRDGIRKTGPTTFEWTADNFSPDKELKMLFVKPLPNY
ncbi:DUF4424 family protein [Afifella sp. IM 167]|uniref:DUF4424 family protein n=1 Tax=Afifella sp. IM 167 TaxID=2033586 RepID=UPI001CCF1484|nr:DUF4424 family protein [Afifella sp. IM 167]MBZ8132150.1 hypothetical protein [Afifella sp. IM 167]